MKPCRPGTGRRRKECVQCFPRTFFYFSYVFFVVHGQVGHQGWGIDTKWVLGRFLDAMGRAEAVYAVEELMGCICELIGWLVVGVALRRRRYSTLEKDLSSIIFTVFSEI